MLDKYDVDRGVKLKKSDITPNDYNPNKTSERQQKAINESLDKYGQLLEIVVRPDPNNKGKYLIVDGEHRYHELDDEVYCNVVHGLSDADAKKLTIIFNETRGQADKVELAQLLASLDDDLDDLIVGLPYEQDELDELVKMADVDWNEFGDDVIDKVNSDDDEWVGMPEFNPQEKPPQLIISFRSEQDREDFVLSHEIEILKKETQSWMTWHPFKERENLKDFIYDQ